MVCDFFFSFRRVPRKHLLKKRRNIQKELNLAPDQNPLCDHSVLTLDNYQALPDWPQGPSCPPTPGPIWASALQLSGGGCSQGLALPLLLDMQIP